MQLFPRLLTRHYFICLFIIVSSLFIAFSTVIYHHYQQEGKLNRWTLYNYEVMRQSRKILFDLVDMETGIRGYLLSGDKSFLEPYEFSSKAVAGEIPALWELTRDEPDAHENIGIWLKKIENFSAILLHQRDSINEFGKAGFSQEVLQKQKQQMDELRTLIESYLQARLKNLQRDIKLSEEDEGNFRYILIFGTILTVGAMLVTTIVILALLNRNQKSQYETKATEERFLTVINGINDGLYDFNVKDQTIYYSKAFKAMLGYNAEEFPDTLAMFNEILHPEDHESTWEIFRQYQQGEIPSYNNVFRLRHKYGNWIWVLSRGVGIRDEKGIMVRLIGTHTDITDQKNREEELKQLNVEMETFTYITSHDLRAPLVNLKGFAGEMERALHKVMPIIKKAENLFTLEEQAILRQSFDEDILESLRFIRQSVEKMDLLTTAVLDLSRIGKREYRLQEVDSNVILQRCLDTLAYEISGNNIQLICNELPRVKTDLLALEQVFSNILDNAVKYLEPARKALITISAQTTTSNIIFSIADNGRGINEADREKVFQIFRRARNTMDVRGQGMGMAFVQATLRRLGGAIWFESIPGTGTTFYFSLPKYPVMDEKLARL